jgi:hypothetical protein
VTLITFHSKVKIFYAVHGPSMEKQTKKDFNITSENVTVYFPIPAVIIFDQYIAHTAEKTHLYIQHRKTKKYCYNYLVFKLYEYVFPTHVLISA